MHRLPTHLVTGEGRWLFAPTYAEAQQKRHAGEALAIVLDWTAAVCPTSEQWAQLATLGSSCFEPYAVPARLVGTPNTTGAATPLG